MMEHSDTGASAATQEDRDAAERFGNAWKMNSAQKFGLANLLARHRLNTRATPTPSVDAEKCVLVCPQCEGEGGYPDGLDEAACHTECTRCAGNGWIADTAALEPLLRRKHQLEVAKWLRGAGVRVIDKTMVSVQDSPWDIGHALATALDSRGGKAMSDIVERLRSIDGASRRKDGSQIPLGHDLIEAADEILSLRARIEELERALEQIAEAAETGQQGSGGLGRMARAAIGKAKP